MGARAGFQTLLRFFKLPFFSVALRAYFEFPSGRSVGTLSSTFGYCLFCSYAAFFALAFSAQIVSVQAVVDKWPDSLPSLALLRLGGDGASDLAGECGFCVLSKRFPCEV